MQAIILAGGFGTRLRRSVPHLPKPMAPIHDKPFLAYLLDYLLLNGITHVVFVLHYLREKIQDYFQSKYKSICIDYIIEAEPLGTGGAILHALSFINDSSKSILVLNGDTFVKLKFQTMFKTHEENNAQFTIALRNIDNCTRFGKAIVSNNRVISFIENGFNGPGLINAGVYCIHPELFLPYQLPKHFSFEKEFIVPFSAQIKPHAFIVDDYFIDIGEPDDYLRAISELPLIVAD